MNLLPDTTTTLPMWHTAWLLGPTLLASAAALLAGPRTSTAAAWRAARWAAGAAVLLSGVSLAGSLALSLDPVRWGGVGTAYGVRADAVGSVMLLLVTFIGWVIVRYAQTYLQGEQAERHFVRWLMATLAAVAVVVTTHHVLVLALAWTATSLALHRLLTFYGERQPARVAAHKKFIVSRAADLCMLAAAGLLFAAFGTLHIDQIAQLARAAPPLPWTAHAAALLIACAALLKCAQLPFHGWLIQVMEAPTPVSALLHAGVVNLGGFVLIRFAPLVEQVPAAQVLLVVAGTTTAVLAALVMTTRISVKVMLAWSTCAQMGFMLMQCGLGAWPMALLHLVAHSLYKAHAFLSAGGAVRSAVLVQLTPQARAATPLGTSAGALVGLTMALAAGVAWSLLWPTPAPPPAVWVLAGIVAFALVPLVHAQALRLERRWRPTLALVAFGVAFVYFGLHALLAGVVAPSATAPPALLWVGVGLAFGGLFVLQTLISVAPHSTTARHMYPWFFGGLFLDELFNRVAFGLWPPPARVDTRSHNPQTPTNGLRT